MQNECSKFAILHFTFCTVVVRPTAGSIYVYRSATRRVAPARTDKFTVINNARYGRVAA